jgi:hypothetical protein
MTTTMIMNDLLDRMKSPVPGSPNRPPTPPFGDVLDLSCPDCQGTGWKLSEKYNRYFICQCTIEAQEGQHFRVEQAQNLKNLETIGLRSTDLSLDWSLVKGGYSDGIKAVKAIQPVYERGHGMIFLWGTYGQAKTLIGKILVSQAIRDGKSAAYANFMDALDNIRQAFDEQENKTTELIRRIGWGTSRQVLFLAEFDKCNDTPWAVERKFQIVDRCYQRAVREEALTVIASNQSDDKLDGYIRSRLNDNRIGPIIHLHGIDGRQVVPSGWKY